MRRLFLLVVLTSIIAGCKGGSVEMPSSTENLKAISPSEVMAIGAPPQATASGTAPTTTAPN
jgi:hypothetical protein